MASKQDISASGAKHSFLDSSFPVLLPELPELRLSEPEFKAHIHRVFHKQTPTRTDVLRLDQKVTASVSARDDEASRANATAPFMDALLAHPATVPSLDEWDGKMLTENGDVAYGTSGETLVDLFCELETVISAERLKILLESAWEKDPDATLRLIWNARSIHLGKSDKITFYRAAGWLAQNHPETFLTSLEWLVRPVIQKKVFKDKTDKTNETENFTSTDDDFEIVDAEPEMDESEPPKKEKKITPGAGPEAGSNAELPDFQIKYGVSHGYWKDLLNILALAAPAKLTVDVTVQDIHCVLQDDARNEKKKNSRDWTPGRKKTLVQERHDVVLARLEEDKFYRALHVTVARLFVDQLKVDISRMGGSKEEKKLVSLCGKWAPTSKKSHDRHTFIVSSIAELLYTYDEVCPGSVDPADRTTFLKYARRAYQMSALSRLRKHLDIVERPISAARFDDIKYERVPSLAMNQYTSLFVKMNQDRFEQYIDEVAAGKTRISGATLLPSTLVQKARGGDCVPRRRAGASFVQTLAARKRQIEDQIEEKAVDGQWKALCQRMRDSGKLGSSIAVCDVSGSMEFPKFKDSTCPIDTAVGLSLLVAEVTEPPFGGAFITFSEDPEILRVGGLEDTRSLKEKVGYIQGSEWSLNTNFVDVFEKLLLPMALANKLKPEEMVKQVFVFSDMQFDATERQSDYSSDGRGKSCGWSTSFERIKSKFNNAGYELPRLIFWNLAGGSNGGPAPKPVVANEGNTVLVSGYSQGQLKMFLENGSSFGEDLEEIAEKEVNDAVVVDKKAKSMDPTAAMRTAISHKAYSMLKVVD